MQHIPIIDKIQKINPQLIPYSINIIKENPVQSIEIFIN